MSRWVMSRWVMSRWVMSPGTGRWVMTGHRAVSIGSLDGPYYPGDTRQQ